MTPGELSYAVVPDSLMIEDFGCKMDMINKKTGVVFRVEIYSIVDNMFRIKINEKDPIRQRYEVQDSLVKEPELQK